MKAATATAIAARADVGRAMRTFLRAMRFTISC